MVEQYYGREDEVETPETQLANIEAHSSAVQAVEIWAKEMMVGMYDKTLELWNAAAERGDVQTQNGLTELYKGAEHMQQNLLHTNTAIASVLETARALQKQKQELEGDLETLVTAIDEGDYNEPRIQGLMERIEEDVYEMISEGAFEEAYESASEAAYDGVYSDLYRAIREISPQVPYAAIERMFNAMKGDYAMSDVQRGLLLSLVRTFEAEVKTT